MMDIERLLFDKYGPLLTLTQTAEILHRSPDGLRVSLFKDNALSRKLNPAKCKIGRRVYFSVEAIAKILGEEMQ